MILPSSLNRDLRVVILEELFKCKSACQHNLSYMCMCMYIFGTTLYIRKFHEMIFSPNHLIKCMCVLVILLPFYVISPGASGTTSCTLDLTTIPTNTLNGSTSLSRI